MRNLCLLLLLLWCIAGHAQKVGINADTPYSALHVASNESYALTLDCPLPLNSGLRTGILFTHQNGPTGHHFTGSIQTIGTSTTQARMGLFTGTYVSPYSLLERVSILNNGNVGIGTINPTYKLDVNGTGHFSNNVSIENGLTVNGAISVQGGKGIVRSVNSSQMKIKRASIYLTHPALSGGATASGGQWFWGENFSSVTVLIGNLNSCTGGCEKIMVLPYNINTSNDSCEFHVTNTSNATVAFEGYWEVVLIGY